MPRHILLVSLLALSVTWSCGSDSGDGGPTGPGGNDFAPSSNTTLSGNQSFDSVTIPAGVTVTVTGGLVLVSAGDVTIAGTLTGDCVPIALTGAAALTVTGEVSNDCGALPAGDPPTLELTADGAVVFDGAVVTSSGDVTVKNNPTLSDADFPEAGLAPAGATGDLAQAQSVRVFEIRNSSEFTHPGSARSGAEGDDDETGQRGRRGARFTFFSRGDLVVDDSAIDGQDGGAGGAHEKSAAGNVTTEGGDGADRGDVKILATERVILRNGSTAKSGDGGNGGAGTATSTGGDGARAGSATATGGDGGDGEPVGNGGDAGTDGTESDGPKNVVASFAPGVDGEPCPEPQNLRVDPRSAQTSNGVVQQGTQTLDIKDETSGQTVGDIVAEFLGTVFVGFNPDRFGLSPDSSIEVRLGEANLNGQPFPVDEGKEQVEVCGVNNPSTETLIIQRRDSGGALLNEESMRIANNCRKVFGADFVSFKLDPSSSEAIDFFIAILDD